MKKISFTREFFKDWRSIGSVTPSSRFLVKTMIRGVDFKRAEVIVELGPGSGSITLELLKRMKANSKLIVFETSKSFCRELKKIDDSRLLIHNESAVDLEEYLQGYNVDYIISGIPLATLSSRDKDKLLKSSNKVLASKGYFVQFQYSIESLKDLKNIFEKVYIDFTPLNLPPAFVFSCIKK